MTLNGPTSKIYHLKPVFSLPDELETNSSMYRMRNLHGPPATAIRNVSSNNKTGKSSSSQADSNGTNTINQVLKRQEELIKNLQSIQTKVSELKLELTSTGENTGSKKKEKSKPIDRQVMKSKFDNVVSQTNIISTADLDLDKIPFTSMVINLNPSKPAYSLMTLPHIWKNSFVADYSIHVHSSVSKFPECFKHILKNDEEKENDLFNIRIIWKDVSDTELITSPIKNIPLLGEVNILRLFNKMLQTSQNIEQETMVDTALDTCHQLLCTKSSGLVKQLAEYLGQNEWMLGFQSISIVDAAAWSAIINTTQPSKLTPNMNKWFHNICSLVGVSKEDLFKSK